MSLLAADAVNSAIAQQVRGQSTRVVPRYDVELGFDQADLTAVVGQIVGEILKRPYRIDSEVKGAISLRARGSLTADDLLSLLSRALTPQGFALVVQENGEIVIVPAAKARQSAPLSLQERAQAAPPGYSTLSVTLSIAKPEDVTRVLQSLAPSVQVLMTDPAKGLIVLGGSREDLEAAQQAISLLDRFQERNALFELVVLSNSAPEKLAAELSPIFAKTQAGAVDIVPVPRRNAVLLVSRSQAAISYAKRLLATFDTPSQQSSWRTYVPRHVTAGHLASLINDILGESSARPPAAATASGAQTPASSGGRVVADESSNLVIVRAAPDEWSDILGVLQAADKAQTQVLIEGVIVEVALTRELRYGLNWNIDLGASTAATLSDKVSGGLAPTFPGLAVAYAKGDVAAVLTALSAKTDVNVVSGPKVLALDGETATLQVGSEVPIVTQTAQSIQSSDAPILSTLSYRNTGVILKVTPRVTGAGKVRIDVAQEVSDVTRTTASGIDSPTFQQRRIESKLLVDDGATVVLGGLISTNEGKQSGGLPGARDLPLIGGLFGTGSKTRSRTELLVFLTPHIINSPESADASTERAKQQAPAIVTRGLVP